MTYQRISLATSEPIGEPGPLPYAVAGWPAELVADLSTVAGIEAHGLADAGFWPVVDDIPMYDPASETVIPGGLQADPTNLRFLRQWSVEALPPPPMPNLTMRQFRLGLLSAGLLAGVEAAIDALDEPERSAARIEFEYAGEVVRTDPWVATLAAVMGLSAAEIDGLWAWAAGL